MIEALCNRFKWPHDFYERMGWRLLQAWVRRANEAQRREAREGSTSEDSWAAREHDGWWDEQHRRARGR